MLGPTTPARKLEFSCARQWLHECPVELYVGTGVGGKWQVRVGMVALGPGGGRIIDIGAHYILSSFPDLINADQCRLAPAI